MVDKAKAIQSVETPHTVDYPIKIRQTLVRAKVVKLRVLSNKGSTGNLTPRSRIDINGKNTT